MAPPAQRFQINEFGVCLHQGLVPYEIKIIGITEIEGVQNYVVHYQGWAKRHDENIPFGSARLHKGTLDEYKAVHGASTAKLNKTPKSSRKSAAATTPKTPASSKKAPAPVVKTPAAKPAVVAKTPTTTKTPAARTPVVKTPASAPKSANKKGAGRSSRARETPAPVDTEDEAEVESQDEEEVEEVEGEESQDESTQPPPKRPALYKSTMPKELQVELTPAMIQLLKDDFLMVKKKNYAVKNNGPTIDTLIKDYIRMVSVTDDELREIDNFVVELDDHISREPNIGLIHSARALVDYFNTVLGYQLLYGPERPLYINLVQKEAAKMGVSYEELHRNGFRASAHYGIIHFIRLVSRLPKLLTIGGAHKGVVIHVQIGINSLMGFLNDYLENLEEKDISSQYVGDESELMA